MSEAPDVPAGKATLPALPQDLEDKPEHESGRARVRTAWRQELAKVLLLALTGALVGGFFAHPAAGVAVVLGVLLAVQLRHLAALRSWLQSKSTVELPEPGGMWGEVFDRLLDLNSKNKKKKKKLAAMLAQFQASTAALPDGAVVLGEQAEIAWFNEAARHLLDLRHGADVGLRIANLIRNPVFTEYMANAAFEGEVEVPAPGNRQRTLSLRVIPYGSNQKLLIARDVSELRRLDRARRDFVANASHELRTPLTVLRGYLDMMEPESAARGPLAAWRAPLAEMKAQSARMEALVADMLRLARLEGEGAPLKEELIDVPQLLRRATDEARILSQNQHRFEVHLQPGLGLLGEPELLSIATNLLSNAVRYTPTGGVIRVAWAEESGGPALAVADSGIGIDEKDIARLTERFYRVDVGRSRASGGTGLGLSIVRHALERHGAQLEIQSEVGVGSTFTCRFPSGRAQPLPVAEAMPPGDAVTRL